MLSLSHCGPTKRKEEKDAWYYAAIKISITTVIQYIYESRRTLSFQIRTGLFIFGFGPWRHEERERHTQFLNANHTMLTLPQRAAHLVMFKIPIHLCRMRSEKLNRTPQRLKNQLLSFQNPQILRAISSGHDLLHTPASFPVWCFIMTDDDCYIISTRA